MGRREAAKLARPPLPLVAGSGGGGSAARRGGQTRPHPSTPTWLWGEVGVMGRFPQSWNHRLQRKTDPKCPPGPFGSDALGPEGSQVLPCCSKCILEPMAPSTRECDCRTEPQRTRFQTHCPRICVLGRSAGDWHAWAN